MDDNREPVNFKIRESCFKRTIEILANAQLFQFVVDALTKEQPCSVGLGLSELKAASDCPRHDDLVAGLFTDTIDSNLSMLMWKPENTTALVTFMNCLIDSDAIPAQVQHWKAMFTPLSNHYAILKVTPKGHF